MNGWFGKFLPKEYGSTTKSRFCIQSELNGICLKNKKIVGSRKRMNLIINLHEG